MTSLHKFYSCIAELCRGYWRYTYTVHANSRTSGCLSNRHGYFSQNVLAACDFKILLTYMLGGWEGSALDTFVLNNALNNPRNPFPWPPQGLLLTYISVGIYCNIYITVMTNNVFKNTGIYLLVDSGYPNTEEFIIPYKATTYHIPNFRKCQCGLCRREEMFNYTHSSLRTCVERTFRVLKKMFEILREALLFLMEEQVMIPVAYAIINKFIRVHKPNDQVLWQYNIDGHTVREVDPLSTSETWWRG